MKIVLKCLCRLTAHVYFGRNGELCLFMKIGDIYFKLLGKMPKRRIGSN